MSEFVIAPLEEPPWRVAAEKFAVLLRERWPGVRVGTSVEGSSMALEALIPLGPGQPELEIALSGTGQAVTLDAADAESASEFAVWFVETMLPGESGAHLMELGAMRAVEVAAGLDADEVRRRLG